MYATIAVHDPVPSDIEIQCYDHENEDGSVSKRTRVKLVSRVKGAATGGFAGLDIHGDTEALTRFLVDLLARVARRPATIDLDGRGEYGYIEKGIGSVLAAPTHRLEVVAPVHDPEAETITIPMEVFEVAPGQEGPAD